MHYYSLWSFPDGTFFSHYCLLLLISHFHCLFWIWAPEFPRPPPTKLKVWISSIIAISYLELLIQFRPIPFFIRLLERFVGSADLTQVSSLAVHPLFLEGTAALEWLSFDRVQERGITRKTPDFKIVIHIRLVHITKLSMFASSLRSSLRHFTAHKMPLCWDDRMQMTIKAYATKEFDQCKVQLPDIWIYTCWSTWESNPRSESRGQQP